MRLWTQRTERKDWLRRPVYRLSLRVEATPDERHLIQKHRLGPADVWLSQSASTLHSEAETAFEGMRGVRSWRLPGITGMLVQIAAGYWLASQANGEARLSVTDLLIGAVFEACEISELIATEAGVRAGIEALTAKLRQLASYDDGEETVTDTDAADGNAHPANWIRMRVK